MSIELKKVITLRKIYKKIFYKFYFKKNFIKVLIEH